MRKNIRHQKKKAWSPDSVRGIPAQCRDCPVEAPTAVDALALPILEIREKTTKEGQGTHSSLNCKEI